jgi:hypothetical protein
VLHAVGDNELRVRDDQFARACDAPGPPHGALRREKLDDRGDERGQLASRTDIIASNIGHDGFDIAKRFFGRDNLHSGLVLRPRELLPGAKRA